MDDQISQLRTLREQIADLSRQLSTAELDGRLLRLTITTELRATMAATPAAEAAKSDPRYIAHERARIQTEYDHAVALAHAEALKLQVERETATADRVGVA